MKRRPKQPACHGLGPSLRGHRASSATVRCRFLRKACAVTTFGLGPVVGSGGEGELADLFRRYAPYVATIGLRLLGRDDDLDDLVQDVFIEAYRGLAGLRSHDAVKGWLARITVRRATRRLRARRLRAFFSLEALPP